MESKAAIWVQRHEELIKTLNERPRIKLADSKEGSLSNNGCIDLHDQHGDQCVSLGKHEAIQFAYWILDLYCLSQENKYE